MTDHPETHGELHELDVHNREVHLELLFDSEGSREDLGEVGIFRAIRLGEPMPYITQTHRRRTSPVEQISAEADGSYLVKTQSGSVYRLTPGRQFASPEPQQSQQRAPEAPEEKKSVIAQYLSRAARAVRALFGGRHPSADQ